MPNGHHFRVTYPTRYPDNSNGHLDTCFRQGYYVEREEGLTDPREVASKLDWPVNKIDVEDLDAESKRVRRFLIYNSGGRKRVAEMAAHGVRGTRPEDPRPKTTRPKIKDTEVPYLRLVETDND